jgi:alkylation response protein AidB-like acyl-CoA dehydrogenase
MSITIHHPSELISTDNASIIRQQSAEAELHGKLTPVLLDLIYRQQWFKMLVPSTYGGLELSLPEVVRLEEALSWADGSLGWVITLCSGAGWFGGFMDPSLANQILHDTKLCIAGSGASTGTAEIEGDGYRINGIWKYASGVHHATHITVNCCITKNKVPLSNASGDPLILPFILDRKDVELLPGWKYIGMIATGSDAYAIKNVWVPKSHCFKIEPTAAYIKHPLYTYPFLQLAEATLTANLSGMAVHFLDLCKPIFEEKVSKFTEQRMEKSKVMFEALQENQTQLNTNRTNFYEALSASWNEPENEAFLKQVSFHSRQLALISREAVDNLYPYCGLLAAAPNTEINRIWRDIHTASQHSLLTFQTL